MNLAQALFIVAIVCALTLILMPFYIGFMRVKQLGQTTLKDGPTWHEQKSGTPTMGGVVFLATILIGVVIFGLVYNTFNIKLFNGIFIFTFFGLIGFADDFIKVFHKQNEGLNRKQKFISQLIGSALFVTLFLWSGQEPLIHLPFIGDVSNVLIFALFTIIWITGFSNAVNLTDGIDGLAASTNIIAYGTYAYLAYQSSQTEVLILCLSVVGGLLGFLFFNRKPAKIFMGDVGSLALGAGLAIISLMLHHEWSLLGIGIVFVCETASVMLQVASFQLRGKRIFKMSPIHHHFEMSGWSEWKVVIVFSLVGLMGSLMTLFFIS